MNFFEFEQIEIIKKDFTLCNRNDRYELMKFEEYSKKNDCSNINVKSELREVTCNQFNFNNDLFLLICQYQNVDTGETDLSLYSRSNNKWVQMWCINLTKLLLGEGLSAIRVDYYQYYSTSNVLIVVFQSPQYLHVARINVLKETLTDVLAFHHQSIFYPHSANNIDFIISPNSTISLLLIDQTAANNTQYCPTITELQLVLNRRLLTGIQSLLSFWITQLTDIYQCLNKSSVERLVHGIPVSQYISFFRIHQAVLLHVIIEYCRNDISSASVSNFFLEHVTNIINDYINEAVNLLLSLTITDGSNDNILNGINIMLNLLCDNSRIYRDLVLTNRPTLSVYQRAIFNIPFTKTSNESKLLSYYNAESLKSLDQNKLMAECLKSQRIASLQIYSMQKYGSCTTEQQLAHQSEMVILASVQSCDWHDLSELISKLGYKPIEALTALCYETKSKEIRDYLYNHLDLDQSDTLSKSSKNFVDQLESSFTIHDNEITNRSFHLLIYGNDNGHSLSVYNQDHVRSFIDGLDKSKCRLLRQCLERYKCDNSKATTKQLINVNLNIFLNLLKKMCDIDGTLSDAIELCLIDADFRKLLMQTKDGCEIPKDRLVVWIYKWRKNANLFVRYVAESCDADLIKSVIDIDFSSDNVIGYNLLYQLTSILSGGKDASLYTDIDRHVAKEALVHCLIQYPEFLVGTLEQLFINDMSRAKDVLLMISPTLSVHLLCQSNGCLLKKAVIKDSPLLALINKVFAEKIVANSCDSEFPIVFYYLIKSVGVGTEIENVDEHYSTRKASVLQSVTSARQPVDIFNCLMSRDITTIGGDVLTTAELDEIAYTALLSGIPYNDLVAESSTMNATIGSLRKILTDSNYWHLLKTRLVRPLDSGNGATNIEHYYEVNIYNFLQRSGIPLSLDTIFVNQSQNTFAKKTKGIVVDGNIPAPNILAKKCRPQTAQSKESLDYIYYLSLGRPYQAFCSIEKEFTVAGKPGCIPLDVIKDIVKSVYHMALSNIDDRIIIGGCFGLLRLIGSSTELLLCYLTLIEWVIDWHVQVNDQCRISESTQTQMSDLDVRKHYATKTMSLFKFCLSNNSTERKNSRDLLIRQIEEIFLYRLNNQYYKEIKDILPAWSLVLYFCQMHGAQFTISILQYYASVDQWLIFLCISQIFGYSKDQVKEALNQFEDVSIRQHMSYILNKVDDLTQLSGSMVQTDESIRNSKTTTDPINRLTMVTSGNVVQTIPTMVGTNDALSPTDGHPIKDLLSSKSKNYNKYSLSALRNSAKDNLFELIFDCQIESTIKSDVSQDRQRINDIRLNIRKLLAYCLALGHPFLSVLAFSTISINDILQESSVTNKLEVYRNCVACFVVSSSPKRIQEIIFAKWAGVVKLDWAEDELIDLVVFAIENGFVTVVSKAFAVLKTEKFTSVSCFFAMISYAMEQFNPILRDSFLIEFVNDCKMNANFVTGKERQRGKTVKNTTMSFVSKLLATGLITALEVCERTKGPRILHEWLIALCHSTSGLLQSHVKLTFPFLETNISLLCSTLSLYFDFIDLDTSAQMKEQFQTLTIPVGTRTKEFMQFVENLIEKVLEKLNSCSDYTRIALSESTLALVTQINSLHSVHLPSNLDRWKVYEMQLKALSIRKFDSTWLCPQDVTDLVSMALSGQIDRTETVSLCTLNELCSSPCIEQASSRVNDGASKLYGSSNSWRRLVIPEEWQDKILNLPSCTDDDSVDKISHVNSLLNEKKWIEACSYMIEHGFSVKDAVLFLTSMKVVTGKLDPTKLPVSLKEYGQQRHSDITDKDQTYRLHVRRMSVQLHSSASKLNLMMSTDTDSNLTKNQRQIRSNDTCQLFLTKVTDLLIHGQELMEYICTIHCVATKMSESYLSVASGEEFDVLTKILVGACRDKIDTADMYLGVVDIDTDKLCNFIAEVIVHVLRLEIQTYIGSTSVMTSTSYQASMSTSPRRVTVPGRTPLFGLSPPGNDTSNSSRSSSPIAFSRRSDNTVLSHNSAISLHENTLKVAERCQLRSEWRTVSAIKSKPESRLFKAFTLQEILILSPNSRKLGKILFSHYQRFSQEVSSCFEDAEFLVHLLIQCHNCFTDGGDTIGISNCLKAAKELTKLLNANGHFVLMAKLLCRIGRYGEMPYIFSSLIENHEFEQLFRKDMDKDGIIVPYVFDYLNRYHNDDYEKMELVCNRYNCYYELAETKTKMAKLSITKLRDHLGATCVRDTAKMLTTSIVNYLLDACKNYLKAGCYKKMEEQFRKAQFYKLQQKWLEDPDKTFAVGPLVRSSKLAAGKVLLPETGLPYGILIINLTSEQALAFLKKIPHFYTAFILSDHLKLPGDIWIELLMHHALMNGDETYLRHYILYFGPVIACNLVQQCLNRLERGSIKLTSKAGLSNLKMMLDHCEDIFFAKRISDTYKLNI